MLKEQVVVAEKDDDDDEVQVRLVIDAVSARLGGRAAPRGLVMLFTLKSLACEFKPATAVRLLPHLCAGSLQGLDSSTFQLQYSFLNRGSRCIALSYIEVVIC